MPDAQFMAVTCKRCGVAVRTYSSMRKWCVDCRKIINLAQAKARKAPRIVIQSRSVQEVLTENHFEVGEHELQSVEGKL